MNEVPLTKAETVVIELAPPCCDGTAECDGQSLLRLGASFTPGDLALLSFSVPADQGMRSLDDGEEAKSINVWFVVVAADGDGENRVLTGILSGEAKRALGHRIDTDTLEQMEPVKFTPRNVRSGIVHRETIKNHRARRSARKEGAGKHGGSDSRSR